MNKNKQKKINLEDNIDLMDEYNYESMLDNNSVTKTINKNKINQNKINEDRTNRINDDYINQNQKELTQKFKY